MAIIEKEKYRFHKGTIIHLDEFLKVSGYVQVKDRVKPHQNEFIMDSHYDPELTDEYEVIKDFTIEVIVRDGKK